MKCEKGVAFDGVKAIEARGNTERKKRKDV